MPYKKGGALYGRLCAGMESFFSPIPKFHIYTIPQVPTDKH